MTTERTTETQLYRKLPTWLSESECSTLHSLPLRGSWQQGRQETGYEKFDLIHESATQWVVERALQEIGNPSQFDAWLIHYPVGSEIPEHTDPAQKNKCHVRFNALITTSQGGELYLDDRELPLQNGDGYLFRPDIIRHKVNPVRNHPRLLLSVGANVTHEEATKLNLV